MASPPGYPLDLSPRLLVLQEIQQVSASMRRNSRWSTSSSSSSAYYHASSGRLRKDTPTPFITSDQARLASSLGLRRPSDGRDLIGGRRPVGDGDEHDLMGAFALLRRELAETTDIVTIPPIRILEPFLALIQSPLTSGPITALALTALYSFVLNLLPLYLPPTPSPLVFDSSDPPTPLQHALSAVTASLAHCRFPSSSPAQDELVLLRLLKVIETLVTSPLENELTDEGVCEMLEVGLGMGGRARLGEGLRKTAQATVQAIVRSGFSRLKLMDPDTLGYLRDGAADGPVIDGGAASQSPQPSAEKPEDETKTEAGEAEGEKVEEKTSASGTPHIGEIDPNPPAVPFTPYGLPTLLELLRVLITLLNPNDQSHTDSMRLSALSILNTALEVGGAHIGLWEELVDGLKDEGCRYLFQLIRSDNPPLLAAALRATSTLFSTLLPHLKLQFELFLSFLIDRLTPPTPVPIPAHLLHIRRSRSDSPRSSTTQESETPGTPSGTPKALSNLPLVIPETKELMLETLTQLAMTKSFMVDLWVNYDCDSASENVFERMIDFLARGVYPSPTAGNAGLAGDHGLDNSQLLCLEALLSFVNAMTDRLEQGGVAWPSSNPSIESLTVQKARKAKLLAGAAEFNAKPKKGVAFLQNNGLIDMPAEPGEQGSTLALAKFLKESARLDKKLLGEYISQPDQLELLKAFIGLFDFEHKSIADAMRELLEAFRLPGEASPIARITEVFAEHFYSYRPPEVQTQDAAYVLAYSVIMLNTDQHNPQNRKRMTIEDYQRNLRGVNDGQDFSPEYLAAIHDSIRRREIIMPQEHVGQAGFDYAWKGLMQRSSTAGRTILCNTSVFDLPMFTLAWRSVISAIASAFTSSAQDEYVIQRAISGFRECATLAGHFKLPEVFDTVVLSLSNSTGLLDETDDGYQSVNYPVVKTDNQNITVSPLSVRFGTSFRSQLATVVLFTIANGHGDDIRDGWIQIFEMFQTLFLHSLLPAQMMQLEDFLAGSTSIPLKSSILAPAREERRAESGLLSTLSSYLLSPYAATDAIIETSDEDIENTLSAIDCISSCKLDVFYGQILKLGPESLIAALQALRTLTEARTAPRPKEFMSASDMSGRPLSPAFDDAQQPYDPGSLYGLETMVSLAVRSPDEITEAWPILFDYISILLSSAQSYSILLIERAVVGLLRLSLLVCDKPALRDQLYLALDVLRSLPSSVLNSVSEQLMAGVAKILEKDRSVVKSQTEWGLITALFRATVSHPEASKLTLSVVQKMAAGEVGPGLSADNFGGVVALLDEFATAAGAAASRQQSGRKDLPSPTVGPTVERGLAALDTLFELKSAIPDLLESTEIEENAAWNVFWLPVLLAIAKHSVNANRAIRTKAIGYLQRLLLSPTLLSSPDPSLSSVFDKVLFPVLEELLKPQVYNRDPPGMEETRLRACALLCKTFLQYIMRLAEGREIEVLFLKVLDLLEKFMLSGNKDQLYEAVPESLKNVILVMHSSNFLLPPPSSPSTPDGRTEMQKSLWTSVNNRIERFLPGFLDIVVPRMVTPAVEETKVLVVPEPEANGVVGSS